MVDPEDHNSSAGRTEWCVGQSNNKQISKRKPSPSGDYSRGLSLQINEMSGVLSSIMWCRHLLRNKGRMPVHTLDAKLFFFHEERK